MLAPVPVVALLALYGAGVLRLHRRDVAWPPGRTAAALTGGACVLAALLSPLGDHHAGFTVHVVQHLLLTMVAPMVLALSGPVTLALRTAPHRPRRVLLRFLHSRPVRVVSAPVVAAVLSSAGLAGLYLTDLYHLAMHDELLHTVVHLHMFATGCLLSWVIVGIDPMPGRGRHTTRLVALVLASAAHDVISKLMYARGLPPAPARWPSDRPARSCCTTAAPWSMSPSPLFS